MTYVCANCGYRSGKWLGRCPECSEWGAMLEAREPRRTTDFGPPARPVPWSELREEDAVRLPAGIAELDRVLGGGLVRGAAILIGGEPGVGKSTLVLQASSAIADGGARVLYVTGEESVAQLRLRGERLGVRSANLAVLAETDVEAVLEAASGETFAVMVVDSIQALRLAGLPSAAGTVAQVRECANRLVSFAKTTGTAVVIVGQVTKDGALAGPRALEHVVDVVLQFEGDRHHAHRLLRGLKNRFGAADELGVFRMDGRGLETVENPSEMFLAERPRGVPGSVVAAAVEGSRTLLVEVQALVGEPVQGTPRRTVVGADAQRTALILAVLQRRAGLDLASRDVFVNVAGGFQLLEPAADLAIAVAIASSLAGLSVDPRCVVIGEVGLAGEVRAVARLDGRLREAARQGFGCALTPPTTAAVRDLRVDAVRDVATALHAAFEGAPR